MEVLITISSSRREIAEGLKSRSRDSRQKRRGFSPRFHLPCIFGQVEFNDRMMCGVGATRRPKERRGKLLK